MSHPHHESREIALQALYQYELRGAEAAASVDALFETAPEAVRPYARALIQGVRDRDAELQAELQPLVEHWDWTRMAVLDRTILKMGAWELRYSTEVPGRVVLDEAIEMAKRFSTKESGAFVNGVLDHLFRSIQAAGRP